MSRGNQWVGYTLIAIGILFLVIKFGGFDLSFVSAWPLFILIPGLLFHFFAFTYRLPGLLVPGGILTTYGILFLFSEFTDYQLMGHLWPVFILGPGIGLLELYIFGGRYFGVLLASMILFAVGGTFLFFSLLSTAIPYLIGFVLIVIGVYVLFGKGKKEFR